MAFEPFMQFIRGIQGRVNSNVLGGLQNDNAQAIAFIRQLQRDLNADQVMDTPLQQLNVVVFDLETTGFFPDKGDQIISIGAIKIIDGKISQNETFYSLVNYETNLSKEITELTGITSEQLKDAPSISEVLVQFFKFVQDNPLVAHHSHHEKSFMKQACWKAFRTTFKHRIFDTSFLYRLAEPNNKLVILEDFCVENNILVTDRHNALGDAKMTAELWCAYVEKVLKLGYVNMRDVYEKLAKTS